MIDSPTKLQFTLAAQGNNLQGPVQNENAELLFQNLLRFFKMVT